MVPDFASLLSRKFSSFNEEENVSGADWKGSSRNESVNYSSTKIEPKSQESPHGIISDSEDDEDSVPSLARGRKN